MAPIQSNNIRKLNGSTVLLWLRTDVSRENGLSYWRGPHAQLVARTPGFLEYRQHHFEQVSPPLWPDVDGIDTQIDAARRIDGVPEVTFQSLLAPLKARRYNSVVLEDEQNVFARTCLYVTRPYCAKWYALAVKRAVLFRTVVLIRKRTDVSPAQFRRFIDKTMAPALVNTHGVLELRSHLFLPYSSSMWNAPNVSHESMPSDHYDAALFIGTADQASLRESLAAILARTRQEQVKHCAVIHAYAVSNTYIYVRDGRPTLPQLTPQPRPALNPIYRSVHPSPARSSQFLDNLGQTTYVNLPGPGSEDVVLDELGRPICGLADGRIIRVSRTGEEVEILGSTRGRPLGLEVLRDGNLLVCDAHRGLMRMNTETGTVESLVQYVNGVPLRFCSNACAAPDGTIWFTESTSRFDFEHYMGSILEGEATGRVLRRDPSGTVTVVADNLQFPNGIALAEDGKSIIVAETTGFRLNRIWVDGRQPGKREVLVENLPGFPDNLSAIKDGKFWVAIAGKRDANSDKLTTLPKFIRKILWKLPPHWLPRPAHTTWAMCFDTNGNLHADRQGQHSHFNYATGVAEGSGYLWLAGVDEKGLLRINADTP